MLSRLPFKTKHIKLKLFYKYISYYVILLLLPIAVFAFIGYFIFLDILQGEIEKNNISIVKKAEYTFENEILRIKDVYYEMLINPRLTNYGIEEDSISAVNEIARYVNLNRSLSDILLYVKKTGLLYGSTGRFTPESFYESLYTYKNWPEPDFEAAINSTRTAIIRPSEKVLYQKSSERKYLTFLFPLPENAKNPLQTVVFIIHEDRLKTFIEYEDQHSGGNLLVLDRNQNVIISSELANYLNSEELNSFAKNIHSQANGSLVLNLDNKEYFAAYSNSIDTGFTYIRLIPKNDALDKILLIRRVFTISVLLLLLAGGMLIFAAIYNNFNPLRDLFRLIKSSPDIDTRESVVNLTIKQAVGKIVKQYDHMTIQVEESRKAVKEQMLSLLLNGQIDDLQTMNTKFQNEKITLSKAYYISTVLLFSENSGMDEEKRQEISKVVEENLPDEFEGYCKALHDRNELVLLLSTDITDQMHIRRKLNLIRSLIEYQFSMAPSVVGVGSNYTSISDLGKSYIEAHSAIDYKLFKCNGSIIFWSEISNSKETTAYPREQLQKLESCIRQWNAVKIGDALSQIMQFLKQDNVSINAAKCICYDVINTVARAFVDFQSTIGEDNRIDFNIDIYSLASLNSTEELFATINTLSEQIQEIISSHDETHTYKFFNEAMEYLKENCCTYDFSVKAFALALSVSESYLRKVFKDKTGMTVQDYVNSIRIETAKRLLLETGLGINEIINQIGYVDAASFIRKFKQNTNMTPGEFRKRNR